MFKGRELRMKKAVEPRRLEKKANRKEVIDTQGRAKSQKWLEKWDIFRRQKSQYADFAAELIKRRNLVKRWLTLI